MEDEIKIRVCKDGPYMVSGDVPMAKQTIGTDKNGDSVKWIEGEKYPCKSCSLCRCGKSKNKPFCDGEHVKIGFKGKETAKNIPYNKQAEITKGKNMILKDANEFCASARFCDPKGGTWNLVEKEDENSNKIAIQQCCDCPSGRLVACDKNGKEIEPTFEKSIGIVEDPEAGVSGPLWIRGGIPIESAEGKKYEVRNRVTLCRCGKSKNKPFCDGEHMMTEVSDE